MFGKKRHQAPLRRTPQVQPSQRPNAVFSYHANRSVRAGSQLRDTTWEQEEINRRSRTIPWRKHLPGVTVLIVVVLLGVAALQLSSAATVETVGTTAGQLFLRDKKVYEKAVQQAFTPWTNSNKLTVNTDKISADLRRQFPELQTVSVSLPIFGNRPVVYIQPAVPSMILVTKDGMFVLDNNGRALISGNQVAKLDQLKVPVINDQSGLSFKTGNTALPQATVAFITEVVGQLKAKGVTTTSLVLPGGGSELHVRIDGVSYFVKFNLHGAAREEAGAFLAVKQRLEATRKTPSQYVDVRVENRAYYR